jgi:hypothetical protein
VNVSWAGMGGGEVTNRFHSLAMVPGGAAKTAVASAWPASNTTCLTLVLADFHSVACRRKAGKKNNTQGGHPTRVCRVICVYRQKRTTLGGAQAPTHSFPLRLAPAGTYWWGPAARRGGRGGCFSVVGHADNSKNRAAADPHTRRPNNNPQDAQQPGEGAELDAH